MTHPAILEETDTSVLKAALAALQIKSQNWSEIDLNRQATKKDHKWLSERGLEHPHLGFEWESADNTTPNWYPQGITGLRSDASENAEGGVKFEVQRLWPVTRQLSADRRRRLPQLRRRRNNSVLNQGQFSLGATRQKATPDRRPAPY